MQTLLLANVFEPGVIGGRIARARREAGLTQEQLADAIGVGTRMVQYYESGDNNAYKHIRQIADVTGTSVRWLLHGEEEAEDQRLIRMEAQVAEIRGMLERVLEGRDGPDEQVPGREPADT